MSYLKFDSDTKIFGVVGYRMGKRVFVPKVYNYLYKKYDINAIYLPFDVAPETFSDFIKATEIFNIAGFGVTMPHKNSALDFMDSADDICHVYHTVNTVSIDKNGKKHGHIFDGYAMCQMIEDTGTKIAGRIAMVIGAGGISGVVADELAKRGATEIRIVNRTPQKAEKLANIVREHTGVPTSYGSLSKKDLDRAAQDAGIVMQCTPLGMYGYNKDFEYKGFIDRLADHAILGDAVIVPDPTPLMEYARMRGHLTVGGMGMLACQKQQIFKATLGIDIGDDGKKAVYEIASTALASLT